MHVYCVVAAIYDYVQYTHKMEGTIMTKSASDTLYQYTSNNNNAGTDRSLTSNIIIIVQSRGFGGRKEIQIVVLLLEEDAISP